MSPPPERKTDIVPGYVIWHDPVTPRVCAWRWARLSHRVDRPRSSHGGALTYAGAVEAARKDSEI